MFRISRRESTPLKKDLLPEDSAKDIQLLFSRAGMSGAKYREFPRQGPTASVAAEGAETDKNTPPLPRSVASSCADAGVRPIVATPAPSPLPLPFRGSAAAAPSYTSLERIFADRPVEAEASKAGRSGIKVVILSLAGGVGKTTLAVTLARLLSGMRWQVLVADCGPYPSVAHHFGSSGQRLGPLQFFFAPSKAAPMPIGIFKASLDDLRDSEFQDLLAQVDGSETVMLIDLPTVQGSASAETLAYADHVLIPVTPDVHSVASVARLQEVIATAADLGHRPEVHYAINRFDESRALHREVKSRLQQLLGPSLLPIVIHEDEAIEEAAAHGMTVVDHSPDSAAVREFGGLAKWVCELAVQKKKKEGLA
jgi:cellulose synthase operon protein YhjQ